MEATATISPNNEEAAYLSCMYRNIKLVDANGEVKWEFDCDRYYYDGSGRYGSYIEQNSYGHDQAEHREIHARDLSR